MSNTSKNSAPAVCWINGHIVKPENATVSVFDHGLLYGDGVFEGIRFYQRKAFLLGGHLKRLIRSARAIHLDIPFTASELELSINNVIQAFSEANGYIRVMVTRGNGTLGIDPRNCVKSNVIIIADHISLIDPAKRLQGAKTIIAATRRLPPDAIDSRIKSLNYLNSILAKIEATNAGADEAFLLNTNGRVAEGTADNVFIVRDNVLLTPPVTDGALEGITRGLILELATSLGVAARETSLTPYDLYTADECFITGTGAELIPVREVDGRLMSQCPGPVYTRLQKAFFEYTLR